MTHDRSTKQNVNYHPINLSLHVTLTTLRYSAMADLAACESLRAPSSHTQQWMPRRPEYTHNRCSYPKSSGEEYFKVSLIVVQCHTHNITAILQLWLVNMLGPGDAVIVIVINNLHCHCTMTHNQLCHQVWPPNQLIEQSLSTSIHS